MKPAVALCAALLVTMPLVRAQTSPAVSPSPRKWEATRQLVYGLPWWADKESEAELLARVKDAESTPDQRLVAVLNDLAAWNRAQKKYAEAEKIYQRVLKLQEDRMGKHYDVALTHNDLGVIYSESGQFEKAEKHFKEALEMWRTLWDRPYRDEDEAVAMHNYAVLLEKTGRAAEAKAMEAKAEEIMQAKEKMLGG
ncbi:MAG TPA: tetratricopeptide repeat protein [Chthoniobacterales bacterium]|nr:tetratricopeptide repeat protein [Chthoniobacterales bacterium]